MMNSSDVRWRPNAWLGAAPSQSLATFQARHMSLALSLSSMVASKRFVWHAVSTRTENSHCE